MVGLIGDLLKTKNYFVALTQNKGKDQEIR